MVSLTQIKAFLSHPNTLSLYRIVAVPVIVILMLWPNRLTCFLAGMFFSIAAITDYFDGFLARKRGLVSNLGKILDPLADKLLVSSAFIMLCSLGWIPAWLVCIIVGREIAVTGLRSMMTEQKEDVSASMLGKYKTGFQIGAIIPLLLHYPYFGIDLHKIGYVLLWGALIFTLWSGADYFIRFRNVLKG